MRAVTVRLPIEMEKKMRVDAKGGHRTISEQIKKYICDAIVCEENPDIPLSFIKETLIAKAEVEAGLGKEYQFGIVR